jgi:Zn-dependent protease with chaperone function
MLGYGALLALSLGWLAVSGSVTPLFINRVLFRVHARLRLILWFGALYSPLFSGITAIICTGVLVTSSWFGLEHVSAGLDNLGYVLLVSVLPWIGLALLAGSLALIITRLEPARAVARETSELLRLAGKPIDVFQGLQVRLLATPHLAAALIEIDGQPNIVVTQRVLDDLGAAELEAVYWHECGHAVGQHNGLRRIAKTAIAFAPWLPLTRAMPEAVESACEELADQFALRRCDAEGLAAAKAKFAF